MRVFPRGPNVRHGLQLKMCELSRRFSLFFDVSILMYCKTRDKRGKTLYWRVLKNGKRKRVSQKVALASGTVSDCARPASKRPASRRAAPGRKSRVKKTSIEKMTVRQLKRKAKSEGIALPWKGTGNRGKVLKKDIVKTIKEKMAAPKLDILLTVPAEIFLLTVLQMDAKAVAHLCATSPEMRKKCGDVVWKELFKRDIFSRATSLDDPIFESTGPKSWEEAYARISRARANHLVTITARKKPGWRKRIKKAFKNGKLYLSYTDYTADVSGSVNLGRQYEITLKEVLEKIERQRGKVSTFWYSPKKRVFYTTAPSPTPGAIIDPTIWKVKFDEEDKEWKLTSQRAGRANSPHWPPRPASSSDEWVLLMVR